VHIFCFEEQNICTTMTSESAKHVSQMNILALLTPKLIAPFYQQFMKVEYEQFNQQKKPDSNNIILSESGY